VILDGPFEASVQPGPVGGEVSAAILFSGSGRAARQVQPAAGHSMWRSQL